MNGILWMYLNVEKNKAFCQSGKGHDDYRWIPSKDINLCNFNEKHHDYLNLLKPDILI